MSSLDTVTIGGPLTAFGEMRTASPGNRFDCEFIYDKQPLLMDDISANSGAATHNANSRDVQLTVTGATDVAGLRSHYWVPYTPGSGQLVEITGTLDEAGIGGGTAMVFLRSTVSGSTTEQTVTQNNWNNATSGVSWNKSHILAMNFQSLKVGTIKFYLVRNGSNVHLTDIHNDNVRATGFWQYPSLPPYWKLYTDSGETIMEMGYGDDDNAIGIRYNLGTANYNATMRAICCTVKSQGGLPLFDMPGFQFAAAATSAVTVSTTELPIVSIQMGSTFNSISNRAIAIPESLELNTDNPIIFRLRYRPSLTNASFAAVDSNYSVMQYDVAATAVSGGIIVYTGFAGGRINQDTPASIGFLGRTIMSLGSTGTSDILTLTAIRNSASDADVQSAIKWREVR